MKLRVYRDKEKDVAWHMFLLPAGMECKVGFFVVWFGKVWTFKWRENWPGEGT